MSDSVDPDETAHTAHYDPSHLDLRCLQKPIVIAYGSERVNMKCQTQSIKVALWKNQSAKVTEMTDFLRNS